MKLKILLIALIAVLIASNIWSCSTVRMYDHHLFMLEGICAELVERASTNDDAIEKLERAYLKHMVEQHAVLKATE